MGGDRGKPIRVLVVGEQTMMRAGIRKLIDSQPGFKVVGEAAGRADAAPLANRMRPDIIIIDIDSRHANGHPLPRNLFVESSEARLMILASVHHKHVHKEAIQRGATGVVMKEQPPETLFQAMTHLHRGEVWLDSATIAEVLASMAREIAATRQGPELRRINRLTPREREVTALVAAGLKNKAIAKRLFISEATVRHHLSSAFSKLGVADRYGLISYAFRYGLVDGSR